MDKQNVLCTYIYITYNEILFWLRKEGNSDTWYNMDQPWKHSAKWNKPDTIGQTLYDSIYMSTQSGQIHKDRK